MSSEAGGAPDYIRPVAGIRIWRVAPNLLSQHMGLLWGPGAKQPWPTGKEMLAVCDVAHAEHDPPADGCGCGLYAFYDGDTAIAGGYWPERDHPFFNRLVAGVMGAAGDIALHEWGFRAQRATVEALFPVGALDQELPVPRDIIADAYGAELIPVPDYHNFCERRGFVTFNPEDL